MIKFKHSLQSCDFIEVASQCQELFLELHTNAG